MFEAYDNSNHKVLIQTNLENFWIKASYTPCGLWEYRAECIPSLYFQQSFLFEFVLFEWQIKKRSSVYNTMPGTSIESSDVAFRDSSSYLSDILLYIKLFFNSD